MADVNYPFSALVDQELMKRALLLNVIDPTLGGVLIKGERGTAKSTGVRALAGLLPTIRVVENCPLQCDPDQPGALCPFCLDRIERGEKLRSRERRVRLVNLPIGATEDRLLGTIDIEKALKTGRKSFEPGLLAEAHRGILYVDEVNLLNDQIVDLFLDAAASGVNAVEREGISFSHPSRFILVGTMNPEEGDLRPQLLDRFGLSVTIEAIRALPRRVEIIKRRLSFERDPEGFRESWKAADEELAGRVARARASLGTAVLTEDLIEMAAKVAVAMETDGHRADIAMIKAASANAALEGRSRATLEDLRLAARLVLPHRIKNAPLEKSEFKGEKLQEIFDQDAGPGSAGEEWSPVHRNKSRETVKTGVCKSPLECVTHLCATRDHLDPRIPWHRLTPGTHPGRRFVLPNPRKGGAVHGCRFRFPGDPCDDISVIGSIRAAAPHQVPRGASGMLSILPDDLRPRKRSRKTGLALVMVVDSSSSMRTNNRMAATKGAIETLLRDFYLRRDKLGIITFRHTSAEVILPLTSNIRDALDGIEKLPVGGRTPLAAGIAMGTRLLLQEMRKNPEAMPAMLVFSDGNPNVSSFGGDPLEETYFHARELKRHKIRSIWVDMEFNPLSSGCGFEIARAMGAAYLTLDRLRG